MVWKGDPVRPPGRAPAAGPVRVRLGFRLWDFLSARSMEPTPPDHMPAAMPDDVLIVEDDPIIALDFEDTIRGFGVKLVRNAASVARALQMIAERQPDFALLDVGLIREKSFAIAERLDALKTPFAFVTGYGA